MTNGERIANIVSGMTQLTVPAQADVERQLGIALTKQRENRFWGFFEGEQSAPPFAGVDLRLSKDEPRALLVLQLADDATVTEAELNLPQYGAPLGIDVNPDIPHEGVVAHRYQIGTAQVSFQLTAGSKTLRLLAIEWGASG